MQAQDEPNVESIRHFSPDERFGLVKAAIAHENLMRPDANIRVLDSSELQGYLNEKKDAGDSEVHEILLIRHHEHYLAAHLSRTHETASCVLLDAANDYRIHSISTTLEDAGFERHYATGMSFDLSESNIQHDAYNCSMFALDHVIQLSHLSSQALHTTVKQHSEQGFFPWDCLPAPLLRNTQSVSVMNHYLREHPDALTEVMPDGFDMRTYLIQGTSKTEEGKTRNSAIDKHVFQGAYRAYQKMQTLKAMDATIKKFSIMCARLKKESPRLQQLIEARHAFSGLDGRDPMASDYIQVFKHAPGMPASQENKKSSKPNMSTLLFKQELKNLRREEGGVSKSKPMNRGKENVDLPKGPRS
jgi:hypothetical protein